MIDAVMSQEEIVAIADLRDLRIAHSALVEARSVLKPVHLGPGNVIRSSIEDAMSATHTVICGKIGSIRMERRLDP